MCLLYYNLCLSKDGAALSGWRPRPRDVSSGKFQASVSEHTKHVSLLPPAVCLSLFISSLMPELLIAARREGNVFCLRFLARTNLECSLFPAEKRLFVVFVWWALFCSSSGCLGYVSYKFHCFTY